MHQLFELKGLREKPFRAEPGDLHRFPHATEAGDDDGDDVRVSGEGLVENLPAVHAREAQVRDYHVEGELVQPLECRFARGGLFDPIAGFPQPFRDHFAESVFVVYQTEGAGGRSQPRRRGLELKSRLAPADRFGR